LYRIVCYGRLVNFGTFGILRYPLKRSQALGKVAWYMERRRAVEYPSVVSWVSVHISACFWVPEWLVQGCEAGSIIIRGTTVEQRSLPSDSFRKFSV
jgi:hypothetical protein